MTCPCDRFIHPAEPAIEAGLSRIPRRIGEFADFRRALLADLHRHPALTGWRARETGDFGLMLLEMWAYVCAIQAFYDEVHAHECYLRTAQRRPSVRRLVELLGYRPRPAVAAKVQLGVIAEGTRPVALPIRSAFRSTAFEGQPPQVFETDSATVLHASFNSWQAQAAPPRGLEFGRHLLRFLVEPSVSRLRKGARVVARRGADLKVCQVRDLRHVKTAKGGRMLRVELLPLTDNGGVVQLAEVEILTPTRTAGLWTLDLDGQSPADGERAEPIPFKISESNMDMTLTLDSLYRQIKGNSVVMVSKGDDYRAFEVTEVLEAFVTIETHDPLIITTLVPLESREFPLPDVRVPATQVVLKGSQSLDDWKQAHASAFQLHYCLVSAGEIRLEPPKQVNTATALDLELPSMSLTARPAAKRFLLRDSLGAGGMIEGTLDTETGRLDPGRDMASGQTLVPPVWVYGNVVTATRGETVDAEILGSGDATLANQRFALAKGPLTYVPSPAAANSGGVVSTLEVSVNETRWREVACFFGVGGNERVYVVRQADDEKSWVTFGDGVRGARLPTGTDNVVARYRFGAGANMPPADSIAQLARPVGDVSGVVNPLAAVGGEDRESASKIRVQAPRSALLLGRAVSIPDMEAVVASYPGVRVAKAEWCWSRTRQRAAAHLWYVGPAEIRSDLAERLQQLCDPSTTHVVEPARSRPLTVQITVEISGDYDRARVEAAIRRVLTDPSEGWLTPERLGINGPLFRSGLFDTIHSVPGVAKVIDFEARVDELDDCPALQMTVQTEDVWAIRPGVGCYFDIEAGAVRVDESWLNTTIVHSRTERLPGAWRT